MPEESNLQNEILPFIQKREYRLVKELGQGACGKTVLLHDETIDEFYVCKKYTPYAEGERLELYQGFVREIKLLYQVHHENVVRVYNHYLYPKEYAGFILMEYIEGETIDKHVAKAPEKINELFQQAISGFAYLTRCRILHRDIRFYNLMVRNDGRLKIIDLGFGKRIATKTDFDKSISLNWWCQTPNEFGESQYDFCTEVYFVGRLFERLLQDNDIQHFKYITTLREMCDVDPSNRIQSFEEVETQIQADRLPNLGFGPDEMTAYRSFADALNNHISKIDKDADYVEDAQVIQSSLVDAYNSCMLEEFVPDPSLIVRCFLRGTYYFNRNSSIEVSAVRDFLQLIRSITTEKRRIVLANLHTRLNSLPRQTALSEDDEIPF